MNHRKILFFVMAYWGFSYVVFAQQRIICFAADPIEVKNQQNEKLNDFEIFLKYRDSIISPVFYKGKDAILFNLFNDLSSLVLLIDSHSYEIKNFGSYLSSEQGMLIFKINAKASNKCFRIINNKTIDYIDFSLTDDTCKVYNQLTIANILVDKKIIKKYGSYSEFINKVYLKKNHPPNPK